MAGNRIALIAPILLTVLCLWPVAARAACTSPAGDAGDLMYNSGLRVPQYCNGFYWVAMGKTAKGLVGWWKLDESTGTAAADDSGSGYTGTLTNGPVWQPSGGQVNGALQFDGTNDYVDVGQVYNTASPVTISAWIKADTLPAAASHYRVLSNRSGANNGFSVGIYDGGGAPTKARMCFSVLSVADYSTASRIIEANQWYHVAFSYTGSQVSYYLNGSLVETDNTGAMTTGSTMFIGRSSAGNYFDGLIDDVRIYNRALSAAEILAVRGQHPIAWWKFDDGAGTTAADSIGSNTGTLTNGPVWSAGKFGGALDFDGSDDYVNLASTIALSGPFSVSAWVYPHNLTSTSNHILLSESGNTDRIFFDSEDADLRAGGTTLVMTTNPDFTSNEWQLFTLVRDGSNNVTAYRNGVAVGSGTQANNLSIRMMGTNNVFTNFFDGLIDDLRIYNYALTTAEITALYNSSIAAGDIIYNQDHHVMQFYDGALWRAMGPQPGAGGGGCSGPAGAEGDLLHNQDHHTMQYCDGSVWRLIGHKPADVTSSLVGWWKLDEAAGTTAADSIGSNPGTLTNGPTWQSAGGQIGGALQFDGSNDYVSLTSNPLSGTAYSVSAWFKTGSAATNQSIFAQRSSTNAQSIMGQLYLVGSNIAFITRNDAGGNSALAQGTTALQDNTWYHAVGVRNGANVSVYLNGVSEGSDTDAGGTITTNTTDIGRYNIGGTLSGYFSGLIDDVRIYNRALSATEVADIYLAGGGT